MEVQNLSAELCERLLMWLDEVWAEYSQGDKSDFLLGQIYAYIECLETILQNAGVDNETLLDIERQYGIR